MSPQPKLLKKMCQEARQLRATMASEFQRPRWSEQARLFLREKRHRKTLLQPFCVSTKRCPHCDAEQAVSEPKILLTTTTITTRLMSTLVWIWFDWFEITSRATKLSTGLREKTLVPISSIWDHTRRCPKWGLERINLIAMSNFPPSVRLILCPYY